MLEKIIRVVREAGELIRCAHDVEQDTTEKTSPSDLVTKYDVAVQNYLRRELLRLLPEADFLGEEGEHAALTQPWCFVVDPIDGTANFVRDLGYSNISVALVRQGTVEYGVVYNPFREELFSARRGEGAWLNEKPIHVSDYDPVHALVLSGSTIYDREMTDTHFRMLSKLYGQCADFRRFGAAALDLCQIAAGRAEILFECRLRPWDFAAGSLILTEAGGRITKLDGGKISVMESGSIFASNGCCHALLETLRD